MSKKLPLEGIRVLDICVVWAGPFATMLLADMGAEVIKVESLQYVPTATRGSTGPRPSPALMKVGTTSWYFPDKEAGEKPWNRHAITNTNTRNKLSMTVDMTRPRGKEIYEKLVSKSDIIIENNSARVMEGLGLGYEDLRKIKQDIIMISMPGLGMTGPYRDFQAFGSTLEAISAHSSLWGYPDLDPTYNTATFACDAAGGAMSAFAALAALRHRNKTGEGQFIDISQAEVFIPFLGQAMMDYTMNGRIQTTMGNRDPFMAPHGCYRCKGDDCWVTIAVRSDKEWEGFGRALGKPEWTGDPKFATALGRLNNQDELDRLISEWTIQKTPYEAMYALQNEHIPAGPVLYPADAFKDPHVAERGFIVEVDHPEIGIRKIPGPLWKNSKTPGNVRRAAPCLGEHNEYVYKEILGVSDAEYQVLVEEKHIGDTYVGY